MFEKVSKCGLQNKWSKKTEIFLTLKTLGMVTSPIRTRPIPEPVKCFDIEKEK